MLATGNLDQWTISRSTFQFPVPSDLPSCFGFPAHYGRRRGADLQGLPPAAGPLPVWLQQPHGHLSHSPGVELPETSVSVHAFRVAAQTVVGWPGGFPLEGKGLPSGGTGAGGEAVVTLLLDGSGQDSGTQFILECRGSVHHQGTGTLMSWRTAQAHLIGLILLLISERSDGEQDDSLASKCHQFLL